MILLDTGYLVALLNPGDSLHARALRWSASLRDSMVVTSAVLWETVNHQSFPPLRAAVHEMIVRLERTSNLEILHVDRRLFTAALKLHHDRLDKEWSLTDCLSFVVMEERHVQRALAYDHHFEQAGFDALLRRDPPT